MFSCGGSGSAAPAASSRDVPACGASASAAATGSQGNDVVNVFADTPGVTIEEALEDAPEAASNAAGAAGSEPPAAASAAHQPTAQEGAADAGAVRAPPLGVEDNEAGAGIRAGDLPASKRAG